MLASLLNRIKHMNEATATLTDTDIREMGLPTYDDLHEGAKTVWETAQAMGVEMTKEQAFGMALGAYAAVLDGMGAMDSTTKAAWEMAGRLVAGEGLAN